MLKKQTILQIRNVYTAHAFQSGSDFYVGAGSETESMVQLYNLAAQTAEKLENCPGGMMSFIPVPGQPGFYVTIMGLFPPFLGKEAGLYLHKKTGNGWRTSKVLDLPFAHRCEFLPHPGRTILVAATVSKFKENPADWSKPGEIHAISLTGALSGQWESELIDSSITRNHGMSRTKIDGVERLCVSGQEGILAIGLIPGESWEVTSLFGKEVSEFSFLDLDGDGKSELITIEPFHGNTLNVYKQIEGDWKLKFSDPLFFGHGLSSGMFNGTPVVVAGNRSDSLALETFTVSDLDKGIVNRIVIEKDCGPTQTQVFSHGATDYILSANQRKHEVALYSGPMGD